MFDGFLALGGIVFLTLATAFFVAGEFGLVTADRGRINQLAKTGVAGAVSTQKAQKDLSFHLSGAQLGITICALITGFLVEPAFGTLLEGPLTDLGLKGGSSLAVAIVIGLVAATAFQMVVGELIPKNLAIANPEGVSVAVATPLRFGNSLLRPAIVFLNGAANLTVRLLGIEPRDELTATHSLEELEILIRSSREQGGLQEEEYSLLARSISFGDKDCADALTPRTSLVTIATDTTLTDLARIAVESGHTRFPVVGKDLDEIAGVANARDIFAVPAEERSEVKVSQIMRSPLVVPESRDLGSLLVEMRRSGHHLAVVADEYGGTAGIITIEDLLEEIVGEIEDEYDPRAPTARLTRPAAGIDVVSGGVHSDELFEATGFRLPEGDYQTLAGFLLSLFNRIPERGDHTSYEGWEFKVVEMDRNRIARVLVVAPVEETESP